MTYITDILSLFERTCINLRSEFLLMFRQLHVGTEIFCPVACVKT